MMKWERGKGQRDWQTRKRKRKRNNRERKAEFSVAGSRFPCFGRTGANTGGDITVLATTDEEEAEEKAAAEAKAAGDTSITTAAVQEDAKELGSRVRREACASKSASKSASTSKDDGGRGDGRVRESRSKIYSRGTAQANEGKRGTVNTHT